MDMATDSGITPLLFAVQSGHEKILALLIKHGVPLILNQYEGYQALEIAVVNGTVRIAFILLEAKVPVEPARFDGRHKTPSLLLLAIKPTHRWNIDNMLHLLLSFGAPLQETNEEGNNALMLAVQMRRVSTIEM